MLDAVECRACVRFPLQERRQFGGPRLVTIPMLIGKLECGLLIHTHFPLAVLLH
jgi:hypothetical protein